MAPCNSLHWPRQLRGTGACGLLDFQLLFFWSLQSCTNCDIRLHVVAYAEKIDWHITLSLYCMNFILFLCDTLRLNYFPLVSCPCSHQILTSDDDTHWVSFFVRWTRSRRRSRTWHVRWWRRSPSCQCTRRLRWDYSRKWRRKKRCWNDTAPTWRRVFRRPSK